MHDTTICSYAPVQNLAPRSLLQRVGIQTSQTNKSPRQGSTTVKKQAPTKHLKFIEGKVEASM